MELVVRFDSPSGSDAAVVGGKGANLGILTAAGFPVPTGFTVTTQAYLQFLAETGLGGQVQGIVAQVDFGDATNVEKRCGEVRALIEAAEVPVPVAAGITGLYGELGADQRVAVRSSGTAEDLEGASFAGQHDTYLHIRGAESVIDAVKRCWASLWTARATAYRAHKGFAQDEVGIAVVVQTMVDSEVAGVMFTANPIAGLTDEFGINASWGLGESVVSGLVTPDAFTLDKRTLAVKDRTLGTKEQQIRLDDTAGAGTVHEDVPQADRDRYCLTDGQLRVLCELGKRVTDHYDGIPQDTEWGLVDGTFYLLQARPVTGTVLAWDEDLDDDWQPGPDMADSVWSRAMSDDGWTGAVTPLFFSFRGCAFSRSHVFANNLYGFKDLASLKYQKYYRGTVYWNTEVDGAFVSRVAPPRLRPTMLSKVSPFEHDKILNAPFSYGALLRLLARVHALEPTHGVNAWVRVQEDYYTNRRAEAAGKSNEELRSLSDEALIEYTEERIEYEIQYIVDIYIGYILHWVMAGQLLAHLVGAWYDGDNPGVLIDLLTGTDEQTFTVKENLELWHLADRIRSSDALTEQFRSHRGAEFFSQLGETEEGRAFRTSYQAFLETYGHRGHADRDIYFIRRAEDSAVDYRSITALLNVDAAVDPTAIEESAVRRKRAAFDDIVANLAKKPLGSLRVEIFKLLNSYNQRLLVGRDNERGFVDICTFTIKRSVKEVNRRIMERGLLDDDRDFFFLGRYELYDVFRGRANMPLAKAKIAGRKHNFDLVNSKDRVNPMYLRDNREVVIDDGDDDGGLRGLPTSGGVATGTARLVKSLEEIGNVKQGEIMVCNSTDPGWTPVFLLLAGAVFETGGAFAHCSCISREYGIPAIQVPGALHKIPDGATITIDGNTGTITVHEDEVAAAHCG